MNTTAISATLARLGHAHLDAVETAERPSSKSHRDAKRSFRKHIDMVTSAVALLEQEREKAWTPVDERLPDNDLLVLIAVNDDDTWTGYHINGAWRYSDGFPIEKERVTHWMPMPTPPVASPT
jgi:hypothetical protein